MTSPDNKSKIEVAGSFEIDLPIKRGGFVVDRRDWSRIKRAVQKIDFKSNKWEMAAWNIFASFVTVFVSSVALHFTINSDAVKVCFWVATLILLIVTILLFIFSNQISKTRGSQKNEALKEMEEVEASIAVVEQMNDSGLNTGLIILRATYGTSEHNIDVAKELNSKIQDNKLLTKADNAIKGDPHRGAKKNLDIRYLYQGQQLEKNYKEGENVNLP